MSSVVKTALCHVNLRLITLDLCGVLNALYHGKHPLESPGKNVTMLLYHTTYFHLLYVFVFLTNCTTDLK